MTTLDDKRFTHQEIATTIVHKTLQSVQRYTRCLDDKRKRKMSDALQESMMSDTLQESTSKNENYQKQVNVFGQQIEHKQFTMIGKPQINFNGSFTNCTFNFVRNE